MMKTSDKIIEFSQLETIRSENPGRKIVQCHGVFDVLHAGHLAYLESAKRYGDFLVLTITSDEFVNKGPGRPYFNAAVRARMLAALEVVDRVCISKFPTAVPTIEALKPHFYVKGPDYRDKSRDMTGAIFDEEQAAQKNGGELVFTSDETLSSSSLINDFFVPWTDDQLAVIREVKQAGGLEEIERVLALVQKQNLLVIGEPIVDTYVFVKAESISSKSPSISARFEYQEDYAGGSLAIANHMADFAKSVKMLTTHGTEPYFQDLLKNSIDSRIEFAGMPLESVPTPRKTRYITLDRGQRTLEVTHLRNDQWQKHSPNEFCKLLQKNSKKHECTLIADFGHGLFENAVLASLSDLSGFIGLNVQTNSSNFGFNPFTKHKHYNYLTMDQQEARVAYHDRNTPHLQLVTRIYKDLVEQFGKDRALGVTLGPEGSYYFSKGEPLPIKSSAFADKVIDPIGAGDAYFSLTSLLVKVGCSPILVPFVGNVFAGLKTRIIGNKSAVSKAQLLKAITAILK